MFLLLNYFLIYFMIDFEHEKHKFFKLSVVYSFILIDKSCLHCIVAYL